MARAKGSKVLGPALSALIDALAEQDAKEYLEEGAMKSRSEVEQDNKDELQRRLDAKLRQPLMFRGIEIAMPHSPLTPRRPEPVTEGEIPCNHPFEVVAERFAERARGSQGYFAELADRIENGDPTLTVFDGMQAAQAIRAYASQITRVLPRPRGDHKVDPGFLAMEFAHLNVVEEMSKNKAHEVLAERHDLSVTGVKKSLEKYGDDAVEWMRLFHKKAVARKVDTDR